MSQLKYTLLTHDDDFALCEDCPCDAQVLTSTFAFLCLDCLHARESEVSR